MVRDPGSGTFRAGFQHKIYREMTVSEGPRPTYRSTYLIVGQMHVRRENLYVGTMLTVDSGEVEHAAVFHVTEHCIAEEMLLQLVAVLKPRSMISFGLS